MNEWESKSAPFFGTKYNCGHKFRPSTPFSLWKIQPLNRCFSSLSLCEWNWNCEWDLNGPIEWNPLRVVVVGWKGHRIAIFGLFSSSTRTHWRQMGAKWAPIQQIESFWHAREELWMVSFIESLEKFGGRERGAINFDEPFRSTKQRKCVSFVFAQLLKKTIRSLSGNNCDIIQSAERTKQKVSLSFGRWNWNWKLSVVALFSVVSPSPAADITSAWACLKRAGGCFCCCCCSFGWVSGDDSLLLPLVIWLAGESAEEVVDSGGGGGTCYCANEWADRIFGERERERDIHLSECVIGYGFHFALTHSHWKKLFSTRLFCHNKHLFNTSLSLLTSGAIDFQWQNDNCVLTKFDSHTHTNKQTNEQTLSLSLRHTLSN